MCVCVCLCAFCRVCSLLHHADNGRYSDDDDDDDDVNDDGDDGGDCGGSDVLRTTLRTIAMFGVLSLSSAIPRLPSVAFATNTPSKTYRHRWWASLPRGLRTGKCERVHLCVCARPRARIRASFCLLPSDGLETGKNSFSKWHLAAGVIFSLNSRTITYWSAVWNCLVLIIRL